MKHRREPGCILSGVIALAVLSGCGAERHENSALGTSRAAATLGAERLLSPLERLQHGDGRAVVAASSNQFMVFGTSELARITAGGTNLDPDGRVHPPLFESSWFSVGPYVRGMAHDGGRFVVLGSMDSFITGHRPNYQVVPGAVLVARYGEDGTQLDQTDLVGPTATWRLLDLACGPGHCLAVYASATEQTAHAVFFRSGAQVQASPPIQLASGYTAGISAAFDGNRYLVAFGSMLLDATTQFPNGVSWQTVRIDGNGTLVDSTPRVVRTLNPHLDPSYVASHSGLATNGSGFVLTYSERRGAAVRLVAQMLDANGLALAGDPLTLAEGTEHAYFPVVRADGANYLALWKECTNVRRYQDWPRCTAAAVTIDAQLRTIASRHAYGAAEAVFDHVPPTLPHLAWNGATYLATWDEPYAPVHARRLDRSGNVLDRHAVLPNLYTPEEKLPAVVWTGCSYLSVYTINEQSPNGSYVRAVGTLLDAAGESLPGTPFRFKNSMQRYELIGGGTNALLLFDFGAQVVSPTGRPLSGELSSPAWEPRSAAPNGDGWLLVGQVPGYPETNGLEVAAHVVDAAGESVGSAEVTQTPGDQLAPSVAAGSSNYFVAWRDLRSSNEIWGVPVTAQGVPATAAQRIGSAGTSERGPEVASDGSSFLVVWNESAELVARRVNASGGLVGANIRLGADLSGERVVYDGRTFIVIYARESGGTRSFFARRIASAGTVLDPVIALGSSRFHDVATDGRGRTLITSERADQRVTRRLLVADDADTLPYPGCAVGSEPPDAGTGEPDGGTGGPDPVQCSFDPATRGTPGSALGSLLLAVVFALARRRAEKTRSRVA